MGFGGSTQAMITAIKNNEKIRRQKRERFKKQTTGGYGSNSRTEYNLPEATPEQLEAIRNRMQKERKVWWVKVIVLTVVSALIVLTALVALIA